MVVGGLAAGRDYQVSCAGWTAPVHAGPDGLLRVRFPDSELGGPPREVTVEPAG